MGYSQTADFTFASSTGSFCAPATIQFTQKCTGKPVGFIWQLGNETDYEDNPENAYASPGTYKVTLTAVYENTTATVTKTITINAPISASVTVDRNAICKPGDINFTAATTGVDAAASYSWNFGDATSPSATTSAGIAHTFSNFGSYNVLLTATSTVGCTATAKATVTVAAPTITASVSPTGGCVPATAKFKASVKVPGNSAVANYSWHYDDGSADERTASGAVNKIYNNARDYVPSLTITTVEGCTASYTYPQIAFGFPPTIATASVDKTSFCASEIPTFIAKADTADNYRWSFGDGITTNAEDTILKHSFAALGALTVKVTPYLNGCAGKAVSLPVNVKGVIASFKYANTCDDRKTYEFKNTSLGNISTITWSFGDKTPTKNTSNVTHTYPVTGQYKTSLTLTDNISGCQDTYSKNIYTAIPKMVAERDKICKYDSTIFSVQDSYTSPATTYTWFVMGQQAGPFNSDSVTATGNTLGNFDNSVVINYGSESCPDTVQLDHQVGVAGPVLDFSLVNVACVKTPLVINNQSKPYSSQDSISVWKWTNNFNGTSSLIDEKEQPQPFVNAKSGKYSITLFASDINGCSDSLVKNYTVNRLPFVNIKNTSVIACQGNDTQLIAWHSDTLKWITTGVVCGTCDTTSIKAPSTMKVYATATSKLNCVATDSILIKVYEPFTATTSQNDYTICEKEPVQLSVDPGNYKITWNPVSNLSSPNAFKTVATPSDNITYTATLTDSANCFSSSVAIDVNVNKLPTVDAGPDKSYPYATNFSFAPTYSSNVVKYSWSPATYLDCITCAIPKGISNETVVYTVSVVSDKGCKAEDSVLIRVECSPDNLLMPTGFTPNRDGLNDYYYPLTRGVKKVLRFAVYNRLGQLIFESKNFPPNKSGYGWDGKFNGLDQPSAAYVYTLDVLCDLGEPLHKQGSFFLLR